MQPVEIYTSFVKDRSVIYPFQYYTEYGESIICLKYSSHTGNALIYLHYDGNRRFIAKAVLSDYDIRTEKINAFEEMEKDIPIIEINFEKLFFDMHLVASSNLNNWYDKDILSKINDSYPKPPILIGGCGRSGTTLLLSILSSHSSIQAINDEIYAFYPRPYRLHRLNQALKNEKKIPKKRWCEKTPKNIRAIPDILQLFGNKVKFIHIVRDPRDVITSVHPNHPDQYWVSPERWIEDVAEGFKYKERTLLIRYEDLVFDMKKTVQTICDYIDEFFESNMLDIQRNATVRQNIAWGNEQIKQIHTQSVQRWKKDKFQSRVNSLLHNEKAIVLMRKLGYLVN